MVGAGFSANAYTSSILVHLLATNELDNASKEFAIQKNQLRPTELFWLYIDDLIGVGRPLSSFIGNNLQKQIKVLYLGTKSRHLYALIEDKRIPET
ncbi:hypothetical protein L1987_22804 [Smallanthus sonchifolius]|uniref:Uncharacterized protein n=1 Tax=Smallanthus sonchifolius TaxID=185202 RepID=A0ACB9IGF8_9ASTR|nr:hypothetical protein L1987_22804 [Smallanthus sonchifolius]